MIKNLLFIVSLHIIAIFATVNAATYPVNNYVSSENSVYQYYIPEDPANTGGYYLWIPPNCQHINGLFLAPKNMDEQTFLEFGETRALCSELGLGIIMMVPSRTSPFVVNAFPLVYPNFAAISGQKIFNYKQGAIPFLQSLLDRMAALTGYAEISNAPLISMGHSWAGAFPIQVAFGMPDRVICSILWKVGYIATQPAFDTNAILNGVPVLHIEEQGGTNIRTGSGWDYRINELYKARIQNGSAAGNPISRLTQYGGQHMAMSDPMMHIVVNYVREACKSRLPVPTTVGPFALNPVNMESGWLVDPHLEKPSASIRPTALYKNYSGNRDSAAWYFSETLARECEQYFSVNYKKPIPQKISFIDPATNLPIVNEGNLVINSLPDDQTFTVNAACQTQTTDKWYNTGESLGQSTAPMSYSKIMGQVEQVGANTFRVTMDRWGDGGVGKTIQAFNFGDSNTQPSMASVVLKVAPITTGTSQVLTFPQIPTVKSGTTKIRLGATTNSGLPIGYFVAYGPAVIEGDSLRFLPISSRCKYPITVKVGAYQLGSYGPTPVKSAGPVYQTFQLRESSAPLTWYVQKHIVID